MKKLDFKKIGKRAMGAAGGGAAAAAINKFLPNLNPQIRSFIKIGAGLVLPELAPKNQIVSDGGVALAGVGVYELANKMLGGTGVQGIGDPEYVVNDAEYQVEGNDENDLSGVANDALGTTNDALEGNDEQF